jgi:periplasmic protein TonB
MLISKFDLYKSEWLELVFDNRNKEYGAYELRQHYSSTMARAMGFTFLGIALLFGAGIVFKATPPNIEVIHVVNDHVTPTFPPVEPVKRTTPPAQKPIKAQPPAPQTATTRFVPPVVTPDPLVNETPPKIVELTGAIGPTTAKGKDDGGNVLPDNTGTGTGTPPAPDNSIYNSSGVDIMPAPVGGEKAWAKFLNKNLRYPSLAQEEGASGMVILSFIIEKDGSLSNIAVDRPAGHGFDEEALRVLKQAKAWKPGMQNGQAVRVRFSIPINFHLSSE